MPPAPSTRSTNRAAPHEEEAADYVQERPATADEYAEEAGVSTSRWGTIAALIGAFIVLLLASVLIYNFFVSRL